MTFFCTLSYSQEELTVKKKLKNTIKWNPTPLAFGGNNWVFGYERVLFPSQTASINVGLIQFPELAANSTGILRNVERTKSSGFTLSADFCFYPTKRNRLPAPDGVYFGPFLNYFQYNTDFSVDVYKAGVLEGQGTIDTEIDILFVGFQLGYQFIIWDRLTLDLILFGPALGMHSADLKAQGDLEAGEDVQEFLDYLKDQFPLAGELASSGEATAIGSTTTWSAGYRYSFSLGFRF